MTSLRLLDPIARTLLDAADDIDRHGWCQGVSRDIFGHICPWFAIHRNAGTVDSVCANGRLLNYLKLDAHHNAVTDWNDVPGRTQAEVTAALRGAALQPGGHLMKVFSGVTVDRKVFIEIKDDAERAVAVISLDPEDARTVGDNLGRLADIAEGVQSKMHHVEAIQGPPGPATRAPPRDG